MLVFFFRALRTRPIETKASGRLNLSGDVYQTDGSRSTSLSLLLTVLKLSIHPAQKGLFDIFFGLINQIARMPDDVIHLGLLNS